MRSKIPKSIFDDTNAVAFALDVANIQRNIRELDNGGLLAALNTRKGELDVMRNKFDILSPMTVVG